MIEQLKSFFLDLTCNRNSNQIWQRHGKLRKSPCPRKISCSDFFIDVHLQGVAVTSTKYSVNPDKEDVAVVAFNSSESQNGNASHE